MAKSATKRSKSISKTSKKAKKAMTKTSELTRETTAIMACSAALKGLSHKSALSVLDFVEGHFYDTKHYR